MIPKAVLFDVGGILVELDGMPSLAMHTRIDTDPSLIHRSWMRSEWVIKHETGQVAASDFADGVVRELKLQISPDRFLAQFASWPRRLMPGCNEVLREVAAHSRIAALSNMSELHWKRVCELGLDADAFEHTFVSYETGFLKPSLEAYRSAADQLQLRPEEIVFVDDSVSNVEAANTLGMTAVVAKSPSQVRNKLRQVGVLA